MQIYYGLKFFMIFNTFLKSYSSFNWIFQTQQLFSILFEYEMRIQLETQLQIEIWW